MRRAWDSGTPRSFQEGRAEGVNKSVSAPCGPVASQEVSSFSVAVAAEDVQLLTPHEREHLAQRCFPNASPANEKGWLTVFHASAK
jgi:hypothetical protein